MGDRVAMIEQACKEMEAGGRIKVLRTSSLWETKAMYVVDQDMFVNGACEVRLISQGRALSILICTDRNIAVPNRAARRATSGREQNGSRESRRQGAQKH